MVEADALNQTTDDDQWVVSCNMDVRCLLKVEVYHATSAAWWFEKKFLKMGCVIP